MLDDLSDDLPALTVDSQKPKTGGKRRRLDSLFTRGGYDFYMEYAAQAIHESQGFDGAVTSDMQTIREGIRGHLNVRMCILVDNTGCLR